MNWNNYALIFIIITIVLAISIEARGGRGGGGGRSSGSRSSGSHSSGSHSSGSHSSGSHGSSSHSSGSHSSSSKSSGSEGRGFWASLFGGSSSSSKTSSSHSSPSSSSSSSSSSLSSSSNREPSQQPSYNPYYQHTDNSFASSPSKSSGSSQSSSSLSNWKPFQHTSYNSYPYYQHTAIGSNPFKASDSTDYLSGYMAGNLLSNRHKVYDSYDNEYIHPRVSVMANNEPESTTTATITTAIQPDMSEWLNILTDFKYNPNDLNSLEAHMTRIANIDLSKVLAPPRIAATLAATPSTTSEMPTSSTDLPSFTTESTTLISELTSSILPKQPTADKKDNVVDSHIATAPSDDLLSSPMTSSGEIVRATTESTHEAKLDISTPYGLICSPIIYNEVNEFGVDLIIEKLSCYPALDPVEPLE